MAGRARSERRTHANCTTLELLSRERDVLKMNTSQEDDREQRPETEPYSTSHTPNTRAVCLHKAKRIANG